MISITVQTDCDNVNTYTNVRRFSIGNSKSGNLENVGTVSEIRSPRKIGNPGNVPGNSRKSAEREFWGLPAAAVCTVKFNFGVFSETNSRISGNSGKCPDGFLTGIFPEFPDPAGFSSFRGFRL
jgi:hypothetical protein